MKCWCWPEVEHLHDVRVHEPGGRQRLAAEARDERRIVREVLGQQLDGDIALEALVEGELHRGHPADAETALDPVAPGDSCSISHPPPPGPPLFPFPGPAPPLLPLPLPLPSPLPVVVPPPSPTPPVVVDVLPVSVGEVAVLVVVVVVVGVVVVVVGVVVLVVVLEDEVDGVVLLVEELVEVDGVETTCRRQPLAASRAIVLAPWLRLRRSVGLTAAGRVWTARFRARLALMAAPQLPA
jgi:hypothetical protein